MDEPFIVDGVEIMYPGDPDAPGYLIWNCRCRTIAEVEGLSHSWDGRSTDALDGMTYEEWKQAHGKSQPITAQTEKGKAAKRAAVQEYRDAGKKDVQYAQQESGNLMPPSAYDGDFSDFEPLELTDEARKTMKELQKLGIDTGWEHGAILYPDGTISKPFSSELHGGVAFKADEIPMGSTLLHCHTNGTPLSAGDLKLLINQNISGIINITNNGDVFHADVNGYHPDDEEFEEFEADVRREIDKEMLERMRDEGWTYEEYVYMCIKEELFRICRQFEWTLRGGKL